MATSDASSLDRAIGAVVGTACGDALGAGYEFQPALGPEEPVEMIGGGLGAFAPGAWTDDTSMAIPILAAIAGGGDLLGEAAQSGIVREWVEWAGDAPDVGIQTRRVLGSLQETGALGGADAAAAARAAAARLHAETGKSAGNGSLMRTAPVALAYMEDAAPDRVAAASRALSDLTHFEVDAGDGCVLWSVAIWHAIRTGEFRLDVGLAALPAARRDLWAGRLDVARSSVPSDFEATNGWVVSALQGAVAALAQAGLAEGATSCSPAALRAALVHAVRSGNDTDTVAAITGGLAGALAGESAVPEEWRAMVHGWPGLRYADLVVLASRAAGRYRE